MSCSVCNGLPGCPVCSDEPSWCYECEGTGMDEDGFACKYCNGEGIVEDNEPDWDNIRDERNENSY